MSTGLKDVYMIPLAYPTKCIRPGILVLLLLCGLYCFPTGATAQKDSAESYQPAVRIIAAEEQFDLAVHFFSSQDYTRAITEFERFCFFFPNDERFLLARFNIGMSHFHMGTYSLALESFKVITSNSHSTDLFYKAAFLISECLVRQGEWDRAVTQLVNLAATADTPEVADEASYRLGWLHLENSRIDEAVTYFARITPPNREKFNVSAAEQALGDIGQLNRKSPQLAGALGVIPGAGYLYTERYQDALISLLVNGLLFWAAYESFDQGLPALGCIAGLAGAGFYTGSIYGSVSSAHKYNRNAYNAILNRYKPSFTVGWGADPNRQRYLLGVHFHF
jgi:TolA-binding protein